MKNFKVFIIALLLFCPMAFARYNGNNNNGKSGYNNNGYKKNGNSNGSKMGKKNNGYNNMTNGSRMNGNKDYKYKSAQQLEEIFYKKMNAGASREEIYEVIEYMKPMDASKADYLMSEYEKEMGTQE